MWKQCHDDKERQSLRRIIEQITVEGEMVLPILSIREF